MMRIASYKIFALFKKAVYLFVQDLFGIDW